MTQERLDPSERYIKDVQGKVPLGGVVQVGRKIGPGVGAKIVDRDCFSIVEAKAASFFDNRNPHPMYTPSPAKPTDARKFICGEIVHAAQEDAFVYNFGAKELPNHPKSKKGPVCEGNGVFAIRLTAPDTYTKIECPGQFCRYFTTVTPPKTAPDCRYWMRLIFRLFWPNDPTWPSILVAFESRGLETTSNAVGFFSSIRSEAALLGEQEPFSLYGLRFAMQVRQSTQQSSKAPGKKASTYPVVSFSLIDPLADVFARQRSLASKDGKTLPYISARDEALTSAEAMEESFRHLSGPKPEFKPQGPVVPQDWSKHPTTLWILETARNEAPDDPETYLRKLCTFEKQDGSVNDLSQDWLIDTSLIPQNRGEAFLNFVKEKLERRTGAKASTPDNPEKEPAP